MKSLALTNEAKKSGCGYIIKNYSGFIKKLFIVQNLTSVIYQIRKKLKKLTYSKYEKAESIYEVIKKI